MEKLTKKEKYSLYKLINRELDYFRNIDKLTKLIKHDYLLELSTISCKLIGEMMEED